MSKLLGITAAVCFGLGTALTAQPAHAGSKQGNQGEAYRMACTVPIYSLHLNDEQRKKWAAAMAEHHKAGCSPESEAKLLEQAKEIMTPEQFAKFKQKYENGPKMKM